MKFSYILEKSPCDWKTTVYWNVVLAIFQTQNIRHHAWKTVRTTLQCIVSKVSGHSPRHWRTMKHQSVDLTVFHAWWHICCVWKIVQTTFQCIVVLQLRADCPRTYTNFMVPGSESVTYIYIERKNYKAVKEFSLIKIFFSSYSPVFKMFKN